MLIDFVGAVQFALSDLVLAALGFVPTATVSIDFVLVLLFEEFVLFTDFSLSFIFVLQLFVESIKSGLCAVTQTFLRFVVGGSASTSWILVTVL